MNGREKNFLKLAGLIFVVYFLPFQIAPALSQFYHSHLEDIEQTKQNIHRYRQLNTQTQDWKDKHAQVTQHLQQTENALLQGDSRETVTARMQRLAREIALNAGVRVIKMEVPELNATGDWLLVTQVIEFEANSEQIMSVLTGLRDHLLFLPVTMLEVRISRGTMLHGSLKIIGFSRRPAEIATQ